MDTSRGGGGGGGGGDSVLLFSVYVLLSVTSEGFAVLEGRNLQAAVEVCVYVRVRESCVYVVSLYLRT